MSTKSNKSTAAYWESLVHETSQTKLWLEGYEVKPTDKNHLETICTTPLPLEATFIQQLNRFTQKNHIQFQTVILSAWGLLLNRYSSSDDVIYGLIYFTEQANQQTLFEPTLPVRSELHENETIIDYLNQLEQQVVSHQDYLDSSDQTAKQHDLFKNLVNYLLLYPLEKTSQLANILKVSQLDLQKYPLILHIKELNPFNIEITYQPEKFTKKAIDYLAQHFILILERILSEPEIPVLHYSILTPQEKNVLFNDWNKLRTQRIFANQTATLHELVSQQAQAHPFYPAIVHNDVTINYKKLDELANQISHMLIHKKVRQGDPVVVLMERTPALIATMLAIFKVGGIYIPINPNFPDERIKFIIEDSNTHCIIVNNIQRIPHEYLYKTTRLDDHYNLVKALPISPPPVHINSDNLVAYAIYKSSGANDQPKGVMIKHESLVNLANWYKSHFSVTAEDRASQFGSQGFDSFFCETIPFLLAGASVHIVDDTIKLTPTSFLPWLAKNKITLVDLPTAYAQILLTMDWPENKIRILKIAGETLSQLPNHFFSFDIWNIYGTTETTIETTFMRIFRARVAPLEQEIQHAPPPIGKPIAHCEIYVVDAHLEPVPIGTAGELLIGGINVSPGYLNRPQLTREKFIRNVFSHDPQATLFRTGDLVRWLSDGNLEFIGRVDHQVKIQGYRFELRDIETALTQHPDVTEVMVLAKELASGQKSLIAYLVPNLEKIRIPFQERCLISLNNDHYLQVLTDDLSKEGIGITGLTETIEPGATLRLDLKLPGTSKSIWLSGKVIWQIEQRAGILIDQTEQNKLLLQKGVEFYLASHNLMETLQSVSTKRNLKNALKKKLPAYMIPSVFSVLPHFPLTFNGKIDWQALPPPQNFSQLIEQSYIPPRTDTEKKIAAIWESILPHKRISITDNFFDIGGNSMLVSQMAVTILQNFSLSIPPKILFDLPFIPIIAEYIDSGGENYTYKSSVQEEINRDAVLQDDLVPTNQFSAHVQNPKAILLTGSAGFLGIYLLRTLLASTQAKIYCLIRKGDYQSVANYLKTQVDHYELASDISLEDRRIIIIPSDLGVDQFGIPSELYEKLSDTIDVIYHCGAQVNTMVAYSNLRTSNVQATMEIIRFALNKTDKPIYYISTLAAANKVDDNGHFIEEFPDAESRKLIGGYAISKWVSERLLTQIKNRGLPVKIFRSGYILGQSDNGITNVNDALLLLMKGCIQLGVAPNWNKRVTLLPVDFASQAIVKIAQATPIKSGVYHIDHPQGLLWTDLIAWLNNYGYNIKLCSSDEWIKQLVLINPSNSLYPFLPTYLSQIEPTLSPSVMMDKTKEIMTEISLAYPEINDALLVKYINYLCQVGFLPTPQNKRRQVMV